MINSIFIYGMDYFYKFEEYKHFENIILNFTG